MGSVTLDIAEYEDLKLRRKQAEDEAAKLVNELVEAKRNSSDERVVHGLEQLCDQALIVIKFAVANLPPETTRNWPAVALLAVSERLAMLPSWNSDTRDLQAELRAFAQECQHFDSERRARKA